MARFWPKWRYNGRGMAREVSFYQCLWVTKFWAKFGCSLTPRTARAPNSLIVLRCMWKEPAPLQSCLIPKRCWFRKMTRQKKCSSPMREMEGFMLLLLQSRWHVLLLIITLILLVLVLVFLATDLITFARTFPVRIFPCRWSFHFCKNSWAPLKSWAASAAFSGQPSRYCCLW